MKLNDEQKQAVTQWISEGAKLSEVQRRLEEQFGLRMTYMEARFLIDDLALVPQEQHAPEEKKADESPAEAEPQSGVRVEVDSIMRPGALVSGKVAFSDGVSAQWSLDHTGRFSLVPSQEGYRPSQADMTEFRKQLETALQRQGL